MTDVSVIIVNYNTAGLVAECVESIIRHTTGISYEVIVVDNNSQKDFEAIVSQNIPESERSKFHFLSLPENIGFGRANNEGLKIAKGRNILFLNPDTLLINNAIKILSEFLDSHPESGACGANVYDREERPNYSFWRFFPGIEEDFSILLKYIPSKLKYGKNLVFNYTGKPLEVAFIIGADLMVKKSVLEEVGPFRKEYFMFSEESDLCFRIKKSGRKIYSVPEAKIIHLEGQSFGNSKYPPDKRIRYMEESRQTFLRLNLSPSRRKISNLLHEISLRSKIFLIQNPEKKDFFRRRLKIYKSL